MPCLGPGSTSSGADQCDSACRACIWGPGILCAACISRRAKGLRLAFLLRGVLSWTCDAVEAKLHVPMAPNQTPGPAVLQDAAQDCHVSRASSC